MNYYVGTDRSRWHSGVPTFARVRYKNVFSGIDLLFHEKDGGVEFDFQVAPGSDPQQIRLKLDGPYAFSGDAIFWLASKVWIRIQKPRAYQMFDGHQREVSANYRCHERRTGVGVGEYDRSRSLTIDPVCAVPGFVPGQASGSLSAPRLAADAAGNAYLASLTGAGTNGPFNCAITKLSSTGTIVYKTTIWPGRSGQLQRYCGGHSRQRLHHGPGDWNDPYDAGSSRTELPG